MQRLLITLFLLSACASDGASTKPPTPPPPPAVEELPVEVAAPVLVLPKAWVGQNSKLKWSTGFANTDRDNECVHMQADEKDYLHRKGDVFADFLTHDNVDDSLRRVQTGKKGMWTCFAKLGVRTSQVVPLITVADIKNADQILKPGTALNKAYLNFWTVFAQTLKDAGQLKPILRFGHEMNLGGGYPWAVPNNISAAQFVGLYKLASDTMKKVHPGIVRCWNPGKSSTVPVDSLWPGDNYVDVVGVDWYDNAGGGVPAFNKEADWTANYMKANSNGPQGVGAWYAFAKKHKKPIGFPEWAMKNKAGLDPHRTVFIQHMHDFFAMAAKEGFMSYESYYNEPGEHRIYPNPLFPEASKLYAKIMQP